MGPQLIVKFDDCGNRYTNVYFQPPPNYQLMYPCIVYRRNNDDVSHADNIGYILWRRYQVTVIDKDPDTEIPDRVARLPMSNSERDFSTDGLNHYIYYIYY